MVSLNMLAAAAALSMASLASSVVAQVTQTPATTVAAAENPSAHRAFDRLLATPVTIELTQASLATAIDRLAAAADVRIYYQLEVLDAVTKPVSVQANRMSLGKALQSVLAGTALHAVPTAGDAITIKPAIVAEQQADGVVTGRVVNAKTKAPIRGATVLIDEAKDGVATGNDGTFRITVSAGSHMLHVRGIGFVRQSRQVTVTDNGSLQIDFTLEPSASVLDEVVVTGTVVATERKAIPNPITVITAEDIERRGITRIDQLFRGEVPGVFVTETDTKSYSSLSPNAAYSSNVYARGSSRMPTSALGSYSNPLKTYVDGVELADPAGLGAIDPKSIERIEIVVGPQAATIYGSGAMGGVMQIFTKRGSASQTPEVTVNAKYGMLENSISSSKTPVHDHTISVRGGTGPGFSYSGTLSYNYSGQWRPELFKRRTGVTVGVQHQQGPVTLNGSVARAFGKNGVAGTGIYETPYYLAMRQSGAWAPGQDRLLYRQFAEPASQVISFGVDYRMRSFWQHSATIGTSRSEGTIVPTAPRFSTPNDTSYMYRAAGDERISWNYNSTITSRLGALLSASVTLGLTGSHGKSVYRSGETPDKQTTYWDYSSVSESRDETWGGFTNIRIGFADQVYATLGLRGEKNPNYGTEHPVDWTPTTGLTYTIEAGDLTVKLLGSYGRATRPPTPNQRLKSVTNNPNYTPSQFISTFANPNLTPEYSRGPQGGAELYYGSIASLTVNRYSQTVSDLIEYVVVDSFWGSSFGRDRYITQGQYQNTARIRQQGWETTASASWGVLNVRGVYSWNETRVLELHPTSSASSYLWPGQSFVGVPTHTGNLSVSYAYRGTSATLSTSFIGGSTQLMHSHKAWGYYSIKPRLAMYSIRAKVEGNRSTYFRPGYTKADLSVTHRLNTSVSLLANIVNIGNSFGSESSVMFPVLGRSSTFGLSVRFPAGN